MKFITELVMKLKERDVLLKPCTKVQLEKLNSIAKGKELPQAYMEFISVIWNGDKNAKK